MLQILFSYIENLSSILNCKIYFVKVLYCASKIPCVRTTCTKQQLLPGMVKTDASSTLYSNLEKSLVFLQSYTVLETLCGHH